MLTMLDESIRQGVAIRVERQIRSEQVLATLWQAMTTYGIPEQSRSDNGSEFIAQKSSNGYEKTGLRPCISIRVARGKMATSKVSIAAFRDECLNREWLWNLREACVVIANWRPHYNTGHTAAWVI